MGPAARFHGLISSLTILIMFWGLTWAKDILSTLPKQYPLISSLSALVSSIGVYRLIAMGATWLLNRSLLIKEWIMGAHFLHGTWIGYFIGHAGDKRIFIEQYDQDLEKFIINGRSYTEIKEPHGFWHSDSIGLDARSGWLTFTYTYHIISRNIIVNGIATFQFERSASYKAPVGLAGYAHDQNDDKRIPTQQIKISSQLLSMSDALEIAMKHPFIFKQNSEKS